ncbi:FAD-containing oxidoreductase [Sphingomonas nostoxanthinifaciens]|uniref:FAD-containing oxidoreductase n=1 Tax=Sphingomonas nostoxanthinifaciens TaxID=2872652 RepID=UPI001CC1E9C9|nr:FAD-containing oxidoreductase [Sphingomonas nostoxanthinifaciens]UAK23343.1 FAD-containing oxidoreductase [Sphingomonas nostoxanthinifaciens]
MNRRFDAIIIGTGQAGPPLAGRLSAAGMTVAIVERHLVGGTCVNTGCKPTKTLVASAYAAHMARRGADFGVVTGPIQIDMTKVHARSTKISADSRASNETWLGGLAGVELIFGQARFLDTHRVAVGDDVLEAPRIFINVGGRALIPDMPGVDDVPLLTNSSLLRMATLPEHLVIIGGSYIGLEFGQIYRRFGSRVTIVEKGPRLIGREDEDVSAAVRDVLDSEGIAIRTGAECIHFAPHAHGVRVGVDCTDGDPEIVASHVLLAVGRVPNTDDLGLDRAGIATDARGYIIVDERLATNVPGIWALGDCNGRGAFTHTSYNDFEITAENLLDGADRKLGDRIPCYALYTDPPLGRVGLSAAQARAAGHRIRVGRRAMTRVGRAVEKDEQAGFMEIVVDADSDLILGGTIFGTGGDEAIHTILDMMANHATATTLRRTMHIHPTVSELIPTIAGELKDG